MCLAVPAQVLSLDETGHACVDLDGVHHEACVELVPDVRIGDFVIVHAGFAISLIDPQEAEETLELFRQLNRLARAPSTLDQAAEPAL
ncbi:HypC/HybG/HupF family hydrogenase formation chaperone [Candidatus Fermentibacteria bacterium]|nr:HypC/HybG/HupF family hydrogenase formation chaperone [Candidatus Fermentibacteria bacterium]